MTIREMRIERARARVMARHRPEVARSILYNMEHGLLCACNRATVPYFDAAGREHGALIQGGVLHMYEDCVAL